MESMRYQRADRHIISADFVLRKGGEFVVKGTDFFSPKEWIFLPQMSGFFFKTSCVGRIWHPFRWAMHNLGLIGKTMGLKHSMGLRKKYEWGYFACTCVRPVTLKCYTQFNQHYIYACTCPETLKCYTQFNQHYIYALTCPETLKCFI